MRRASRQLDAVAGASGSTAHRASWSASCPPASRVRESGSPPRSPLDRRAHGAAAANGPGETGCSSEAGDVERPAILPIEPVAVDLAARRHYSFSRLSGHLHRDERPPIEFAGEDAPESIRSGWEPWYTPCWQRSILRSPATGGAGANPCRAAVAGRFAAGRRSAGHDRQFLKSPRSPPTGRRVANFRRSRVSAGLAARNATAAQCADRLHRPAIPGRPRWLARGRLQDQPRTGAGVAALRRATRCKCSSMPWRPSRVWARRRPAWCCTSCAAATNTFDWDAVAGVSRDWLVDEAIAAAN